MNIKETIAIKKVKEYLAKNEMTLKQFADKCGLKDVGTVSRWINGVGKDRRYPNPENQRKINKILYPNIIINEWIIDKE
jgi:transcriptional regulator with XRE-family HTH domain